MPATNGSAYWHQAAAAALEALESEPGGLTGADATARLERFGPNTLAPRRRTGVLALLVRQFENPIILILVVASVLAFFLGDIVDSAIILAIVLLSGLLGFWREREDPCVRGRRAGQVRGRSGSFARADDRASANARLSPRGRVLGPGRNDDVCVALQS